MLLLHPLASLIVLATGVVASRTGDGGKVVSIPINKRTNSAGSYNIVQKDKRRSSYLSRDGEPNKSTTPSIPLNDIQVGEYLANISIGNPPVYCDSCQFLPCMVFYLLILDQLIVDTGSSFTWVGANKSYVETTTSKKTSSSFVSFMSYHRIPVSSNQNSWLRV